MKCAAPLLLLAFGCRPDDDKPPHSEDSLPTDTSPDSADDSGTDDTSTPDSEDTGPDTQETADTGVPPADWDPGDDIPGWDDFDCAETAGGQALVTEFPDVFTVEGRFLEAGAAPWAGPHLLTVKLRDCEVFPCGEEDADLNYKLPYVLAELDGTWGDGGDARGQGWWGPDEIDPRRVTGSGNGPLQAWSNGTYGGIGTLTVCIARVRPDEVSGAVRIELAPDQADSYLDTRYYPTLIHRFPFQVRLDDHAGFDTTAPDRPPDRPDGYLTAHFLYDQPYATAWPWDEITDPGVREAVYSRYEPYNTY